MEIRSSDSWTAAAVCPHCGFDEAWPSFVEDEDGYLIATIFTCKLCLREFD